MTFELKPEPSKMLVALHGSNIWKNAADYAIMLAKNNHEAEIFCHRCDRPFANIQKNCCLLTQEQNQSHFPDTACSCAGWNQLVLQHV